MDKDMLGMLDIIARHADPALSLEIAENLGHEQAVFDRFTSELEDVHLPTVNGIALIEYFPPSGEREKEADGWEAQWAYWKCAALECAALNHEEGVAQMPANTEDHISDVYAKHFMTNNPLASPRYNVSIAMMKFATHQVLHAFGRLHGLPYPHEDGSYVYNTPGPAIETAMQGSSTLEREVERLWPEFCSNVAARVGFDLKSVLEK